MPSMLGFILFFGFRCLCLQFFLYKHKSTNIHGNINPFSSHLQATVDESSWWHAGMLVHRYHGVLQGPSTAQLWGTVGWCPKSIGYHRFPKPTSPWGWLVAWRTISSYIVVVPLCVCGYKSIHVSLYPHIQHIKSTCESCECHQNANCPGIWRFWPSLAFDWVGTMKEIPAPII